MNLVNPHWNLLASENAALDGLAIWVVVRETYVDDKGLLRIHSVLSEVVCIVYIINLYYHFVGHSISLGHEWNDEAVVWLIMKSYIRDEIAVWEVRGACSMREMESHLPGAGGAPTNWVC